MDLKSLSKVETEIYQDAQALLKGGVTAVAFSSRVFGPEGLLRKLWKTDAERKALVASELYKALQKSQGDLRDREAVEFEREIAAHSGRLTVVVPKSLHAALKREAVQEGVSLSELIRLKLGVSYRDVANLLVAHDPPNPKKRRAI